MNTKIFLAEDDPEDIEFFTDIVTEISPNIKISVAKNGVQLMGLFESEEQLPDFIFLDLNMPIKTGFECLNEIRSFEKWNFIKIVILSTSSHPAQVEELYKMGADLYLKKPTDYNKLKIMLNKCLRMEWEFIENL